MKAKALIWRALRAPLAVATACVAALACSPSVALASSASDSIWQPIGGEASLLGGSHGWLTSAVCTGPGNCLAAGAEVSGSSPAAVVVASSGYSWGTPVTPTLTGGQADSDYTSVACMSAGSCVVVGAAAGAGAGQEQPIAGTIAVSGSTVTTAAVSVLPLPAGSVSAALSSVSCTASSCTAVGYYLTSGGAEEPLVATYSGASWTFDAPTAPGPNQGADLNAVSCPSDGACEAVGNYLDSNSHLQSWAVQLSDSETPQPITPPGDAQNASGGLTSAFFGPVLTSGPVMTAISCPSVGACTAVGTYESLSAGYVTMAVKLDNGTVAGVAQVPPPSTPALSAVTAIWCADADDCTVNGYVLTPSGNNQLAYVPVTGYESAGAWSGLTSVPGAVTASYEFGAPGATGLGCTALDNCLSIGIVGDVTAPTITPYFSFSAAPLSVSSAALPAATVGQPFTTSLQASGGTGVGTWSITSGSLPAGLTLNASTGVISGTPTAVGISAFEVQLTSAGGTWQTASVALAIDVEPVPSTPSAPSTPAAPATGAATGAAAGTASLAVGKLTPSSVTLSVGCAGSGGCKGTATVTAVEHFKGKKLTGVRAHAKTRTVRITLARGSYSLAAGHVGRVTLKLNAKARALLRRLHRISGKLTLTPAGASKPTVTRTVTFRSATKKK